MIILFLLHYILFSLWSLEQAQDPDEKNNVYGDAGAANIQHELERRLAIWYLQTTGIAPFDKDPRNAPPFYPTPTFDLTHWQSKLLNR